MNKQQIQASESTLELFTINVMGKEYAYEGKNYICYPDMPVKGFNFAYIFSGNISDLEATVEKAEKFFSERKTPFNVVVSDAFFYQKSSMGVDLTKIDNFFSQREYSRLDQEPRMILEEYKGPKDIPLHENVSIREVSDDLLTWSKPLETAFESTNGICIMYAEAHMRAIAKCKQIKHFTLFVENEPISSITITYLDQAAQIDDMGTRIDFQGKGYGTSLFNFAMEEMAKNFGVKTFFLNSSKAGYNLYKKFGFEDFYFLNIYSQKL